MNRTFLASAVCAAVGIGGMALARAREAFERGLAGHVRGKIVLRVTDSDAIP